ncbi:hypothetical protein Ddc_17506 [Ditylenchus destructor]|nr:hypothetical protein Ddc_17506 [Ditylenchus destructor]
MPPKQSKPPVPMVTRSRAKAKNNAEPQPPVHAKRSRRDMSPVLEEVIAEDDALDAGGAFRDGCSGKVPAKTHIRPEKDSKKPQMENCKPSINKSWKKNEMKFLNIWKQELYQPKKLSTEYTNSICNGKAMQ